MISYIYALCDPLKSGYRYVGKTINPRSRFLHHTSTKCKRIDRKQKWIFSVIRKGVLPLMVILEEIHDPEQVLWQEREIYWINKMRREGHNLTNFRDGGGGDFAGAVRPESLSAILAASFTPERRAAIAESNMRRAGAPTKKRSPLSEEHKAKLRSTFTPDRLAEMSRVRRGVKRSPESIAKAVAKMIGRKNSPETLAKKAAAWTPEKKIAFSKKITGRRNTPETLAKMSAVAIAGERWKNFSTSTKK